MYITILGRQPELSLAELESLYASVEQFSPESAILDAKPSIKRLGGTQKIGLVLAQLSIDDVDKLKQEIADNLSGLVDTKKVSFGISLYGEHASNSLAFELADFVKNKLRNKGINARNVPNKSPALNTAQVWHNKLDSRGLELLIVFSAGAVIIAKTIAVQNADSYTKRDRQKPARDMQIGMLPPKLAQIMLNLALADKNPRESIILDPFCGLGTVLIEATLMGATAYGSDLSAKMVDATKLNLAWVRDTYRIDREFKVEFGDATTLQWSDFDVVVSELYLGPIQHKQPNAEALIGLKNNAQKLYDKTIKNLSSQMKPGQRLCIAVPCWRQSEGFSTINIDSLEEFGYNPIRFNTNEDKLIYARDEQFVGRHLIVATKE